ncbi:MAG: response regulator [Gammaproteobacteria bacterium]
MLVDEQDLVRSGLGKILNDAQGMKVVADTRSYDDALKLLRNHSPRVVLLDLHMPSLVGLDVLRKMLRINEELRVIAITGNSDDVIPTMAFQAGAVGFLHKRATVDEVLRAVRVVSAGQRYLSPDIAQRIAFKRIEAPAASPFDALSEREMQIAILIVNGERPLEIANKLCLSPKTVNGYRYRMFEKLNIDSDVELTKLAIKYRLIDIEFATEITDI